MEDSEVIIIGGSYAGLAAAMSLGRALRRVLIIDSGLPCNRQTPHSHNFLTRDGEAPAQIAAKAREQVLMYPTVQLLQEKAIAAHKEGNYFLVQTQGGGNFHARKLIFTTGMKDEFPAIPGFAECWGISVLHCPYCHGYEVRHEQIGLIGNGDFGFELTKLIQNWSKQLKLFTNGASTLSPSQRALLERRSIPIIEEKIVGLVHEAGYIQYLLTKDGKQHPLKAIFARPALQQHCALPQELGCELTPEGFIKVDAFQRTTVPGIYAGGDNTIFMRSVAVANAAGSMAGAILNKDMIEEEFV